MAHKLVIVELGTLVVDEEPPGSGSDSSTAHVTADSKITKEEPARDEGVGDAAGRT